MAEKVVNAVARELEMHVPVVSTDLFHEIDVDAVGYKTQSKEIIFLLDGK